MSLMKFLSFMLLFLVNFLASTANACVDFAGTYNTAESWYDVSLIDNGKKYCWGRGPATWDDFFWKPKEKMGIHCIEGRRMWVTRDQSQVHYCNPSTCHDFSGYMYADDYYPF